MELFIININETDIPETQLLKFKKKEISNPKKLREHCIAYFMLDKILRETYKIETPEIIFEKGKPRLKNLKKHFSISHSGEFIAIVFSDFNCGIDIEKKRPREYKNLAKRMGFNCNSLDEFYQSWTLYEAKFKLNETPKTVKTFDYENYSITVVSSEYSIIKCSSLRSACSNF